MENLVLAVFVFVIIGFGIIVKDIMKHADSGHL